MLQPVSPSLVLAVQQCAVILQIPKISEGITANSVGLPLCHVVCFLTSKQDNLVPVLTTHFTACCCLLQWPFA